MTRNAKYQRPQPPAPAVVAVTLASFLLAFVLALPSFAQRFTLGENQLAGVRLSESPKTLLRLRSYGAPDAVIASGGVFNTRKLSLAGAGGPPHWAQAVWVDGLGANQVVWMYDRYPVAVAFVITGEGDEAEITDIVVSVWKKMEASSWAVTKKGIRIGDTFLKVVQKYGFPETLVVFQGASTGAPAAGGPGPLPAATAATTAATAAGEGSRSLFRRARFRSRRFEDEEESAPAPVVGVAAPAPGTRAGPLPPAAPTAAAVQEGGGHFSGVAMGQQFNLSRHMVLGYPQQGIDFYLYDMRVMRIHVYGVSAGVAPTAPAVPAVASYSTAPTPAAVVPGGASRTGIMPSLRGAFRSHRRDQD